MATFLTQHTIKPKLYNDNGRMETNKPILVFDLDQIVAFFLYFSVVWIERKTDRKRERSNKTKSVKMKERMGKRVHTFQFGKSFHVM